MMENTHTPGYHTPVLLEETIQALRINPEGVYVDCTFGGGGHSRELLKKLDARGRLIVFDQDADARQNLPADDRVVFVQHNFRHLQRFLRLQKIPQVDGIMADLGVSSHQFDQGDRGFSTRFAGNLDMRMDTRQELTAAKVLNERSEQQLHRIFEQYGEVTNSKTLAATIVEARKYTAFQTIADFKHAIQGIVKGNPNKYFAQVFQALRIEVNDEMGALREMLAQIPASLKVGGRAAIITFHSIEDRLVKTFFRQGSFEEAQYDVFGKKLITPPLKMVNKKPIVAGAVELKGNPRSRSAKLRVAEKTGEANE